MNALRTIVLAVMAAGLLVGCEKDGTVASAGSGEIAGDLVIFHAGSLAMPFKQISAAFTAKHPGVRILAESAGSRACARKISDLDRPCDVMASADYKVVTNLLMPSHAAFNIRFATNEMAIVFADNSKYADKISAENWPEILLAEDVSFGRSDPDVDPCGYRTLMVFQLAEKAFGQPGLAELLAAKDRYIRPKETDLLALLEAGEIDYLFIYRSVGRQHGLKLLLLPDEVNLKSAKLAPLYRKSAVKVTGKKLGEFITRTGEAMVYSVTVPVDAPNRAAAEAYVAFLLSPAGQKIMSANDQPVISPALADGYDRLPAILRPLCVPINEEPSR